MAVKATKDQIYGLISHFVDLDWKLQKRVLNFIHLPPTRKGANIADCILTRLREWEIENKGSVPIFFAILTSIFFFSCDF